MNKLLMYYSKTSIIISLVLWVSTINAQSCDSQKDIDEMSYALGLAQAEGLKEYLAESLDVDTTYMDSFAKGVVDAVKNRKSKEKDAFYAGTQIGQQIVKRMIPRIDNEVFGESSNQGISIELFTNGIIKGCKGATNQEYIEARKLAEEKMEMLKARSLEKELFNK